MRKSQIIIDGLKRRLADTERQRDEARDGVSAGLGRLHDKTDALSTAVADLRLEFGGLAESVRNAIRPKSEPAAAGVTPIAAKRGKAAG